MKLSKVSTTLLKPWVFFFLIFSDLLQIFIAQICLLSEHFLNFNFLIVLQQELSKPNYEDVKNFSSVKSFLLLVLNLPPDILCCAVLATSNNHSLFPLSITTLILQTSVLTVPICCFFFSFRNLLVCFTLLHPFVPAQGQTQSQNASAQQGICWSNLFFLGTI